MSIKAVENLVLELESRHPKIGRMHSVGAFYWRSSTWSDLLTHLISESTELLTATM